MKLKLEEVIPDSGSSFRILLTPRLNHLFYWHFHPEYEIVFVQGGTGTRHIGDHISRYENGDLVFIGPNIPHLNFDFGLANECELVVVQMKEDFLGKDFMQLPEMKKVNLLFEKARTGLLFSGDVKKKVGEKLTEISKLDHFEQLMELLQIFRMLSETEEMQSLNVQPISSADNMKEQQRMKRIYRFIEDHYQEKIDSKDAAQLINLSTAAFCRYFKKITRMTFTDFLNQYRINQAKKILLMDKNVTEACFDTGFENLSHFNKTFRKIAGENPSQFRKRHLVN